MTLYCPHCDGELYRVGESRSSRFVNFCCHDCGEYTRLKPPDHVILRHPNTVECTLCGTSYQWNCPVPFSIMLGGNEAFGWEHYRCGERRDELRVYLVGVLKLRMRILLYAEGLLADYEREHGPV